MRSSGYGHFSFIEMATDLGEREGEYPLASK